MPPTNGGGLIASIQALTGAAGATLTAAGIGRLIYHGGEVRAGRRPLFGLHLIWEVPTAVGMAFVGEALGSYLGLSSTVTTGIVATLSYLGPRGARDIIDRVFGAKP